MLKEAYICDVCNDILYKDKYTKEQAEEHRNIPVKDFNFPEGAVFKYNYKYNKDIIDPKLIMIQRGRILKNITKNHEKIYDVFQFLMDGSYPYNTKIICNEETKKNLINLTQDEIENIKDDLVGGSYKKEDLIFDFKLK